MIRLLMASLFIIMLAGLLNNCTIFKKEIKKSVVVAMPDTTFLAAINSSAVNPKYTGTLTARQVVSAFLKGFKTEGKNTSNVTLQFSEEGADFILKFSSLKVEESSKPQIINDPKSPYNGKEVILNTVECSAVFDITDTKNSSKKLTACTNSKQRSENETSNRNLDDLISGNNKDHTQYHTKLLPDNISLSLSEDVGRRIWVPITRRIAGDIK